MTVYKKNEDLILDLDNETLRIPEYMMDAFMDGISAVIKNECSRFIINELYDEME